MNAVTRLAFSNDNAESMRSTTRASEITMGLGPNQLTWLRRRHGAFADLEEQRRQVAQDAVRAARIAGLI